MGILVVTLRSMESDQVDDEPIVPAPAVEAVWRAVQALDADDRTQARELLAGADEVVHELGHAELGRAAALLVAGLLSTVLPDDDAPRDDEDEDMVGMALKAVTTRIRVSFPEVSDRIPLLVAVVSAGLTGQNAVSWCERVGVDDPHDALALTYLLWLVRDLVDSLYEQPGIADELVTTALLSDQPEDPSEMA